jgi:cytochrome c-type biogenesis protein CcmH/NrfG
VYFKLPQTLAALRADRVLWLSWLAKLNLSAYRDPEYDYWQVLACHQADDSLQFFWQSFVVEAGRLRSVRYLNLGLLALARLPLAEEDSLRNLRLQVQSLVNRYQRRKSWGVPAQEALAQSLRGVIARNPSMKADSYRVFLTELLSPLGEDKTLSVLSLLGLAGNGQRYAAAVSSKAYKLKPPGLADDTDQAARAVRQSRNLAQAWNAIRPLLNAHEAYLHKSGDAYYFVRTLDTCARALCKKYSLREPEIQAQLFQWIQLALRLDADDPRLWMLWELALRQAGQPQRAQWVLWEMTRRFPNNLHCRLELARMLADSASPGDQAQADRLLRQVLRLDADNLHAHSTLAQLAIRRRDWPLALHHAQQGLRIAPNNEPCAILLATAYVWRREPGDLPTAIGELQRFVSRYPGNLNAEGYLRVLQYRQQLAEQGRLPSSEAEDEAPPARPDVPDETDAAWRVFADSIQAWLARSNGVDAGAADRVLPLPQALRQAVAQGRWEAEVLAVYDAAAQREFPLEISLWLYLQSLQAASDSKQSRARQAVERQIKAAAQDNPAWQAYLEQCWQALDAAATTLPAGTEWLEDLLDRYQPLPAPLVC